MVCLNLLFCHNSAIINEVALIGHAFKLTVDDVEQGIWEEKDVAYNIPRTPRLPVDCKLNSFFRIYQSQSTPMKVTVSHTPEIDEESESVSTINVCCIHRALFLFQIFWRLLPTYLLSPFLDCEPYLGFHWQSPSFNGFFQIKEFLREAT